jgi:hypothetical protein
MMLGKTLPGWWRLFFCVLTNGRQRDVASIRVGLCRGILLRFRKVTKIIAVIINGRQRERISARARTPSGETTKVP